MRLTSWDCCVLVYDSSGDSMVRPGEPGISLTDMSGSQFEVGASTSKVEVEKSKKKRAVKIPY